MHYSGQFHSYISLWVFILLQYICGACFLIFVCEIFLQEAVVIPPHVAFAIRPNPGFWEFVKVSSVDLSVEGITATDYLKYKEMIVDENWYVQLNMSFESFLWHFSGLICTVKIYLCKLNYYPLQGQGWECIGTRFWSNGLRHTSIDFIIIDWKWIEFHYKVPHFQAEWSTRKSTATCRLFVLTKLPGRSNNANILIHHSWYPNIQTEGST